MKTSNRQQKPSIALNVLAVVVAFNVAGAAVYLLVMRHKARDAIAASMSAVPPGEPTPDVSRALRAAGLVALESGRYEEAVKRFTEAAKSSKASADLPQLMKIAMELRDRASATQQPRTMTTTDMAADNAADGQKEEVAKADEPNKEDKVEETKPAPTSSSSKVSSMEQKRREREAAQREREKERQRRLAAAAASSRSQSKPDSAETEPSPPVSQAGTIIVSSTPSGLTVQLDGKTLDQTPLRVTAESGAHEIALLHNNTVVFNRRLNVVPSSVQSLDPDVSAQVALLTPARNDTQAPVADNTPPAQQANNSLQTPQKQPETPATDPKSERSLDPNTLYVVANPSLGLASVSSDQLADLYFGRATTLNGHKVEPILRSPSAGAGAVFFRSVLHSNTRSYREAWQRLELSTKATPPPILANATDVWRAVLTRSGAVSFALGSELNASGTSLKPIRIAN